MVKILKMIDYLEINKNNIKFKVVNKKDNVFWKNYQNNEWESDFFKLFDRIPDKNIKSFIDIGAAEGPITLYVSNYVSKTISIEPSKYYFNLLSKNILLNNLKNAHVLFGAIGLIDKKTIFKTGDEFSSIMFGIEKGGYEIDVYELSSIIKKYDISKFILKIDIEGYEFNLLNNSNFFKLISNYKPPFFLGVHLGCSSLFKYKIAKYNFLQRFYNLSKTFSEYRIIYKLLKEYKYAYIQGVRVSNLFFLTKKYYRKNFDIFLTNEPLTK